MSDQWRHVQTFHHCRRWTLADQAEEASNRLRFPFHDDLNRAPVLAVAHPAPEHESTRFVRNKRAKTDSLNTPGHDAIEVITRLLVGLIQRADRAFAADQSRRCSWAATASAAR